MICENLLMAEVIASAGSREGIEEAVLALSGPGVWDAETELGKVWQDEAGQYLAYITITLPLPEGEDLAVAEARLEADILPEAMQLCSAKLTLHDASTDIAAYEPEVWDELEDEEPKRESRLHSLDEFFDTLWPEGEERDFHVGYTGSDEAGLPTYGEWDFIGTPKATLAAWDKFRAAEGLPEECVDRADSETYEPLEMRQAAAVNYPH